MMLSSIVRRPKSMATVVVVFWLPTPASSIPTEALVIAASVVNGEISDSAPTNVVFPAPNPPDTRILAGTGGSFLLCGGMLADCETSECSDTLDQPFQE